MTTELSDESEVTFKGRDVWYLGKKVGSIVYQSEYGETYVTWRHWGTHFHKLGGFAISKRIMEKIQLSPHDPHFVAVVWQYNGKRKTFFFGLFEVLEWPLIEQEGWGQQYLYRFSPESVIYD